MDIIRITILGLFFGTFGTTLGGIIGILFNNPSNKFISFMLSLASGLMLAVVCFDLIPEASLISNSFSIILGILIGIIIMIYCDNLMNKKINKRINKNATTGILKTGIIVSIGLALHNIPEGLAIGSGFDASIKLGFSLAIAIAMHDIPEGISMSIPMKKGGLKNTKIIKYVILSGVTTGIGAFFGALIGEVSQEIIAICLSLAAGAMLYIVSGELTPEYNKLYSGRIVTIGNILGFILGYLVTTF